MGIDFVVAITLLIKIVGSKKVTVKAIPTLTLPYWRARRSALLGYVHFNAPVEYGKVMA